MTGQGENCGKQATAEVGGDNDAEDLLPGEPWRGEDEEAARDELEATTRPFSPDLSSASSRGGVGGVAVTTTGLKAEASLSLPCR